MTSYHVTRSRRLSVSAAQAYALIADYRTGHPRIVPPRYFSNLTVEKGGVGAGTTIRFTMHVLGTTTQFRAHVTEPEPGRVLVETNEGVGSVTTFIVDRLPGDATSSVTITTEFAQRPGFAGKIERFITGLMVRRIYLAELKRIEQVALADSAARVTAPRAA